MCAVTGVVVAGLLFPAVGAAGLASNMAAETLHDTSAQLTVGDNPTVTTMTDREGTPIAWLFDQYRVEVSSDEISDAMKLAMISIEDRRFLDHDGVDWQGTIRAALTNATSGSVQQGASTLNQQYVKNYLFLVAAQNDAERQAAVETTPARKLREMQMAMDLDSTLSKDEILTRYLNLVPFGNGAFGIEAAARTYFNTSAKDLTIAQSAMLAGMVQSTAQNNPYTHPEATLNRRNTVIETMKEATDLPTADLDAAKQEPLGVGDRPRPLQRGCIASGDRGFFCDFALQYLSKAGLSQDILDRGGYTIKTTLDPKAQDAVTQALTSNTSPTADGAATVMNIVKPGNDSREVLAMGSSRRYGLDLSAGETVQPQPFSLVGNGAGSVFKIFTSANAITKGLGINTQLAVPRRIQVEGLGHGGTEGCPETAYCVGNVGTYKSSLSLTDALAQSPNTTFVNLIKNAGVPDTVDMAVKLGLRSYTDPGSWNDDQSIADFYAKGNLGSFTLGPAAVNPLELSNAGATLASNGVWCEPNPILSVKDRQGNDVEIPHPKCSSVLDAGVAQALLKAMSKDDVGAGTSAAAARQYGWSAPLSAKTGTTESHQSAAFLGITSKAAAATYSYNDSPQTLPLCSSPLRQCGWGDLYGGKEPARTWYAAMTAIPGMQDSTVPDAPQKYLRGTDPSTFQK